MYIRTLNTDSMCVYNYSYETVIPSSELGGVTVETPPTKQKQWWVSSRWLTDSDIYNEWMNEEDYELLLVVCNWLICPELVPQIVIYPQLSNRDM